MLLYTGGHKPVKLVDSFGDWLFATTKNGVQTLAKNLPILFFAFRYAVQGCLLRRKQLLHMIQIDTNYLLLMKLIDKHTTNN